MSDKLNHAFDSIKADEILKDNTQAYIQQHIEAGQKRRPLTRRLVLTAACLLFMLFAGGFSYNLYFTPTAYVDVDVNPSIELTLNRSGRVLGANAYNDDGELLLSALQLRHKGYEDALDELLTAMRQDGYLKEGGLLSITVQAGQKEDELLAAVQAYIHESLEAHRLLVQQEVYAVDTDTKTHSHDLGVSPARYLAIEALQEVDPTATVEECRDHSISELREYTKAHGRGHHNEGGHTDAATSEDAGDTEASQEEAGHHAESGNNTSGGHGGGHG